MRVVTIRSAISRAAAGSLSANDGRPLALTAALALSQNERWAYTPPKQVRQSIISTGIWNGRGGPSACHPSTENVVKPQLKTHRLQKVLDFAAPHWQSDWGQRSPPERKRMRLCARIFSLSSGQVLNGWEREPLPAAAPQYFDSHCYDGGPNFACSKVEQGKG